MIVVAIVGILTTVALPMYADYTARAQVAEGFSVASGLKVAIADYVAVYGKWPADNLQAGVGAPCSFETKYIERIEVSNNTSNGGGGNPSNVSSNGFVEIEMHFHDLNASSAQPGCTLGNKYKKNAKQISGKKFALRGKKRPDKEIIDWECFGGQNATPGNPAPSGTDTYIEEKYLPAACRPAV